MVFVLRAGRRFGGEERLRLRHRRERELIRKIRERRSESKLPQKVKKTKKLGRHLPDLKARHLGWSD
jgi:hypothetical protein